MLNSDTVKPFYFVTVCFHLFYSSFLIMVLITTSLSLFLLCLLIALVIFYYSLAGFFAVKKLLCDLQCDSTVRKLHIWFVIILFNKYELLDNL